MQFRICYSQIVNSSSSNYPSTFKNKSKLKNTPTKNSFSSPSLFFFLSHVLARKLQLLPVVRSEISGIKLFSESLQIQKTRY